MHSHSLSFVRVPGPFGHGHFGQVAQDDDATLGSGGLVSVGATRFAAGRVLYATEHGSSGGFGLVAMDLDGDGDVDLAIALVFLT